MRYSLFVSLFLTSLFVGFYSPIYAADSAAVENNILRAEYDLAKKGQVYLLLNLEKKEFEIRSSGMKVATIPISEIRPWGPIPEPGLHIVKDKDRVPEREKIKIPPPGGDESASKPVPPPAPVDPAAPPVVKKFDVQATEVTDMPSSYTLLLEGGGVLVIKSFAAETNWKERMLQRFERPLWNVSHAVQSVSHHYKKEPYSELMLVLSPADAQRLYWALPIGSALLIPAARF